MPPMPCETLVRLRRPLFVRLSLHLLPPSPQPARPALLPSLPSLIVVLLHLRLLASSVSLALAAARSLGLSEARPLVFLLFPSRLRLLLVITTNLSRINSPSGINSSTVQAEKEKVIAGVGTGNSPFAPPPSPCCFYSSMRATDSTRRSVCPLRRKRKEI